MKLHAGLWAAIVCATLLLGCVNPGGGTSAGGGSAASAGQKIVVNGHPVTLQDLVTSPIIRQALLRYVQYDTLKQECAKKGIEVSQTDIDKRIEEQKTSIMESGQDWDEWLKQQGLTLEEVIESERTMAMFEKLSESLVTVTEEEAKQLWDTNKDMVIAAYMRENHLPESEKASITWETCKDTALKMAKQSASFGKQQEVVDLITVNATLVLEGFGSAEDDKRNIDLILGNAQAAVAKRKAEESQTKSPMEMLPGGSPDGSAPPAEGAGEGQTPPPAETPQEPPAEPETN